MLKKLRGLFTLSILIMTVMALLVGCAPEEESSIKMAVEFVDHAACAHIAQNKGWYEEAGLNIASFDNYLTGTALASALSRGHIDAAYICLIPALNVYANGKVPIKVVAGTHKYGYGLLVNPEKIKTVYDLQKPGIRIGCPREGSVMDVLLHRTIEKYRLDEDRIMDKVQRMSPPRALSSLQAGQLDAAFLPEQFPSMGEESGFKELLSARDLWPEMQGSVLVVRDELIRDHPEVVEKLVQVTERGTGYIHEHPQDAARIVAGELTVTGEDIIDGEIMDPGDRFIVSPEAILNSLHIKMECTTGLDPGVVQAEIDYLAELGYIKWFSAGDILDVRFLEDK